MIAVQDCPVHFDAGRPELAQRKQKHVAIVSALYRMPH
jgi:hypothetical protein